MADGRDQEVPSSSSDHQFILTNKGSSS